MRDFFRLYGRVVLLLRSEKQVATVLLGANLFLAALVFVEPTFFGRIVDELARAGGPPAPYGTIWQRTLPWLGLWIGFGLAGIGGAMLVSLYADRLAHRRRLAAMAQFFTHVLNLPPAFHGETHSGRLMKVALTGADHLFALYLSMFREHLSTVMALVILLPIAVWRNWRLGLLLLALTALYCALVSFVIQRTEARQRRVENQNSDFAARAGDVLGNVVVVQTFERLQAEAAALDGMMRRVLAAQMPVLTWWAVASVLARAMSAITLVALFALGIFLYARGLTSVGEIVSYLGFATLLIGRLEQALNFFNRLFLFKAGLSEYFAVLDTPSSIVERPHAPALPRVRGHVRFEAVSLTYDGRRPAVRDLDFAVEPGMNVALVGATGSGKSTTVALLMRLRDPDRGRITVDGVDIRDVGLASLRANIGAVFQDSLLFNRSIADNLRVGRPEASLAEITAAARSAEAHDFIAARPNGYETLVGERGLGLSGGERQRLAIARAMLKDPPILVLDEATSALDAATEAKIQAALRHLLRGRTSFVIAHRLATIRNADLILVLDEGRIIERGGFDELVRQGGRFAELVRMQFGGTLAPDEGAPSSSVA